MRYPLRRLSRAPAFNTCAPRKINSIINKNHYMRDKRLIYLRRERFLVEGVGNEQVGEARALMHQQKQKIRRLLKSTHMRIT